MSDMDITLEVETLCRVIASAKRYDTVKFAVSAIQQVLAMKKSFHAEVKLFKNGAAGVAALDAAAVGYCTGTCNGTTRSFNTIGVSCECGGIYVPKQKD